MRTVQDIFKRGWPLVVCAASATAAPACGVLSGEADAALDQAGSDESVGRALDPFVLLNEVEINPPGSTDVPWEYAEILCTPGISLSGYYFVAIEGDGAGAAPKSPGVADVVVDLGATTCGANG